MSRTVRRCGANARWWSGGTFACLAADRSYHTGIIDRTRTTCTKRTPTNAIIGSTTWTEELSNEMLCLVQA